MSTSAKDILATRVCELVGFDITTGDDCLQLPAKVKDRAALTDLIPRANYYHNLFWYMTTSKISEASYAGISDTSNCS